MTATPDETFSQVWKGHILISCGNKSSKSLGHRSFDDVYSKLILWQLSVADEINVGVSCKF